MRQVFRLLRILILVLIGLWILATYQDLVGPGDWHEKKDKLHDFTLMYMIGILVIASTLFFGMRLARLFYSAYLMHRSLLEIEMNLAEMFNRLKAKGVDNRRDRMVSIMTAAEQCKINPNAGFQVTVNQDRGSTQKTARVIIDADKNDLASFRNGRRSARINALAYEAVLNGQFVAARNYILTKQLEALDKGKELPQMVTGLAKLLNLPSLRVDRSVIERELENKQPLGVFPVGIHLAIRFWKHPASMTFRKDDQVFSGKDALSQMRLI